jgi:zinc protease
VERRKGEVGRLLLSLPIPAAGDPDLPALRLAAGVLGIGRSSRLYRDLVDEAQLCAWTSVSLAEAPDPGAAHVTAELVSGTEPRRVEEAVLRHLEELAATAPSPAEVERAREVLFADWTFAHERISQQGLTAGSDLTLFHAGWSEEQVRSLAEIGPEDVRRAAERHLRIDPNGRAGRGGAVLGWSLPENGRAG